MITLTKLRCTRLANAIILQAVTDYRKSLRGVKAAPNVSVADMKRDCERFFVSDWFSTLTKINGTVLMKQLQEEYSNECNAYPKHKTPNRHYL